MGAVIGDTTYSKRYAHNHYYELQRKRFFCKKREKLNINKLNYFNYG